MNGMKDATLGESRILKNLQVKLANRQGMRATATSRWSSIAKIFDPAMDTFYNRQIIEGLRRDYDQISSIGQQALVTATSLVTNLLVPSNQKWHGLAAFNVEDETDIEVRRYLDKLTSLLFRYRYAADTNFQTSIISTLQQVLLFGNGVLYTEANYRNGNINYISTHIDEHFFVVGPSGVIEDNIRLFPLKPEAFLMFFNDPGDRIPETVIKAADQGSLVDQQVIHWVYPNPDYQPGNKLSFKYTSHHVHQETNSIIRTGGYNTFPYHIFRFRVVPREMYGRGMGDATYSEMKAANQVRLTDLRARNMAADPSLLATTDMGVTRPIPKAGAFIEGGIDAMGNPTIKPLILTPYPQIATDTFQQMADTINRGFMVHLMEIVSTETKDMTATEVLLRKEERLGQISPYLEVLQSDNGLSSLILRELDLHKSLGTFNAILEATPEALARDGRTKIQFDAPVNRIRRIAELSGIQTMMNMLVSLEPIIPGITARTLKLEDVNELAGYVLNVPAEVLYTKDEQAQIEAAQANAQAQQMALQAAQVAGQVTKDVAQARSYDTRV